MGYSYEGLKAFGTDEGTLWIGSSSSTSPVPLRSLVDSRSLSHFRKAARGKPIVWYVDDERGNREWFRDHHVDHFAVVTFSARRSAQWALMQEVPCDAVVADMFFPPGEVTSESEAEALLSIYPQMAKASLSGLGSLWQQHRDRWALHGFDIAQDVADAAVRCKRRIPVFLFSQKGPLLISVNELLGEPAGVVENSYWMIEKIDPTLGEATAARAARIQRTRITAALKDVRLGAPIWQRALSRVSINLGPFSYRISG